jgi:predicted nucleic acid-binding protein
VTPAIVLVDTNVLFSRVLRDYLMYAALAGLVDLRWSPAILDELERTLVDRRQIPSNQARQLRTLMDAALPSATTIPTRHDHGKAAGMSLPDEHDRHVIAAAIAARADFLCTTNVRDFPPQAMDAAGLSLVTPDQLLHALVIALPTEMLHVHETCVANLRAATSESTLAALERAGASTSAGALRAAIAKRSYDPSGGD